MSDLILCFSSYSSVLTMGIVLCATFMCVVRCFGYNCRVELTSWLLRQIKMWTHPRLSFQLLAPLFRCNWGQLPPSKAWWVAGGPAYEQWHSLEWHYLILWASPDQKWVATHYVWRRKDGRHDVWVCMEISPLGEPLYSMPCAVAQWESTCKRSWVQPPVSRVQLWGKGWPFEQGTVCPC